MSSQKTSLQKQLFFWLIIGIIALAIIAALREILLPFILGLAIAYFLDPVADLLERTGFSRLWATIFITVCFGILLATILIILIPIIITELHNFATSMPENVLKLKTLMIQWRTEWFGELQPQDRTRLENFSADLAKQITALAGKAAASLVSGGFALFNIASLILITPVVAFYMLKDWDGIVEFVDRSLPRDHASTVRRLAKEINQVMAGFVRGQVTILILLGMFYMIGLSIVGLNFGVLIGLVAGLISFIPFVGSVTGFLLAGGVALVQFLPEWTPVFIVLGIFLTGQIVEGNVLSPKIVGDSVKLHPVWLIFSLFVFGYLLGFIGLIIAVPVAAAIGVLVRFAFEKYYESEYFQGQGDAG